MLDFFSTVIGYIETIWDFFLNLINSLLTLISALGSAILLPPVVALAAPSFLAASVTAVAGIAICKLIIGRDN